MATNTPRVGFYMPADDGSEPINVATDLNDNLEKMDNSVGFIPSTSLTPPASEFDGMAAYESDTGKAKFLSGSTWKYLLTAGASFLSDIVIGAGKKIGLGINPEYFIDVSDPIPGGGVGVLRYKAASENFARIDIADDGIRMGNGIDGLEVGILRPAYGQIDIVGAVNMDSLNVAEESTLADVSISGELAIDGTVTSDLTVLGQLSGTGFNVPNIIRKATATSRLSTTTPANDPDFFFTAEANSTYLIELYLIYSATTAVDFKCSYSFPVGSIGLRWCLGMSDGGTDRVNTSMRTGVHLPNSDIIFGGHSAALFTGAQDVTVITVGATPGDINFKWSQNVSSGTDAATLRETSIMKYTKIA